MQARLQPGAHFLWLDDEAGRAGQLLRCARVVDLMDVDGVRKTPPVPVVHPKIGSFAFGVKSCLRYNRSVCKPHVEKIFDAF